MSLRVPAALQLSHLLLQPGRTVLSLGQRPRPLVWNNPLLRWHCQPSRTTSPGYFGSSSMQLNVDGIPDWRHDGQGDGEQKQRCRSTVPVVDGEKQHAVEINSRGNGED